MKASFNPLFADRTFSTTVTIKAWCSSETDARRSMSVSIFDTSGSSEAAAGVRYSFEGIRPLAPRIVSGSKPDRAGPPCLIPEP